MSKSAHAADDDDAGTKIQASLVGVEEREGDRPTDRDHRHLFSRFYAALARPLLPEYVVCVCVCVWVVQGGNNSSLVKQR